MNHKINLCILLLVMLSLGKAGAQECDCESNFQWMKKTFEENDAGFQYIIEKKGQQAYNIHNALFSDKIKAAKSLSECASQLNEWLKFFRSGHIGISMLVEDDLVNPNNTVGVEETYNIIDLDIPQFKEYLNSKKDIDYEGIWETTVYVIAIKKELGGYMGYIVESGTDAWKKGQLKLKINNSENNVESTFYMKDHSARVSGEPEMLVKNYLNIGNTRLKRIYPVYPVDEQVESYLKISEASSTYGEELDSSTVYIRIPSFDGRAKSEIDSVVSAYKDKILSSENLILDLRGNGGGSDNAFGELLPLIYTNPIRSVGVQYLSTKINNQRMLDFANDTIYGFDEEDKKWALESYKKLELNLNNFVNLDSDRVRVTHLDTKYTYPINVGIIIDGYCGSTTEEFLLAAKQSKKVKLFGTKTFGSLDVSNMYSAESPCKEFELWYCLSKSYRIPDMAIDDMGIQPDYYIDKSIPEYEWVDFVRNILNQ